MPLPGGAADKLGNRYEDWWTALRAADLLRGRAFNMRFEPLGPAGSGIEFEVEGPDGVWREQVKDARASGPWTLARLKPVLAAVSGHLAEGKNVRLVLSTGSDELHELTYRARAAESLAEFEGVLTKTQQPVFGSYTDGWSVSKEIGWRYLQLIHVEHHPSESLRRIVSVTFETLVEGDPETAVDVLHGFFVDHIHQRVTGPQIWQHLAAKGIRRRLLAGDSNTLTALAATAERFSRRIKQAVPSFGLVSRSHAAHLRILLESQHGPQVVICESSAGMGKSTVAAEVLSMLTAAGWTSAAVRMDSVEVSTQTAAALGRHMNLAESPAILLAGVANGGPGILVIDQLDAVSHYSGRMSEAYESVADVLEQLLTAPNIKVLLVARTVDIEKDPRLVALTRETRVTRFPLEKLDEQAVRAILSNGVINPSNLTKSTVELLTVPLHLSVFSRLAPANRATAYSTLQDLYEQYTSERRMDVARRVSGLDWVGITNALIDHMNSRETLTAPAEILHSIPPEQVEALVSDGVLVRDGHRIGFFHESYFDFLFAQAFVTSRRDLHRFLIESGQLLFRRAQTRQILEYLHARDPELFGVTAAQLISSKEIRSHLKDVVVSVLRQIQPSTEDWLAIEAIAWSESRMAPKVRGLLAHPAWFDAADHGGRWERWLADPQTVDLAFQQLVYAGRQRGGRVEQLVRPYVGVDFGWRGRLSALLAWSLTEDLADLAVDLVAGGHVDGVRGPIAINSDFWSLLYEIAGSAPAAAVRIMGAFLRRNLEIAQATGSDDPFESGRLSDHSQTAHTVISQGAAGAPHSFVSEVLPFVIEVARATARPSTTDPFPCGRWAYMAIGSKTTAATLYAGLDQALRTLATSDPLMTENALSQLADAPIQELQILAAGIYSTINQPDRAMQWLLSDTGNLNLGWPGNRWASRQVIEAASPGCTDDMIRRLSDTLLVHYPAWELQRQRGEYSTWGWSQYELLSAIAPPRRDGQVRRRVAGWERKFPGPISGRPSPTVVIGTVRSPISEDAASHMTDEQWRRALIKYTRARHERRIGVGGAYELAQVLARRAESDPERFFALALTLDSELSDYLMAILDKTAPLLDEERLAVLILRAFQLVGSPASETICRAIQAAPSRVHPVLIDVLDRIARDPHPESDTALEREDAEAILTAGMNSTRGQAGLALAALLFQGDRHLVAATPIITSLATDSVLAVRACAAEAVRAMMHHDKDTALDLAEQLLSHPDVRVHNTITTNRLLIEALIRAPERFGAELARALHGPAPVAHEAGGVWAIASVRGILSPELPTVVHALPTTARQGAAAAFATQPSYAVQPLIELLDDPDDVVRTAALAALGGIAGLNENDANTLITAALGNPAFSAGVQDLVTALDGHPGILPKTTIDVCARVVELAGNEIGDIRTSNAATGFHLVSLVTRLYRQGTLDVRRRCLDIIDALSEAGAIGLTEALETEPRDLG
ncbi:hypothetical protein GCM10009555_020210 [Acrocarpospora macrocephala]|uniref:AAA+ ATPase domain-containing protein n=1 Tax=Acrocarpospora macrocephala TaxID=150177 RepID=A0A5M3WIB8_9ACTN|nr:hypothetical protein [Acrocarpospora macrocephala]GES07979.1 hypothetical protein Amac_015740 [Acrocarpospora macrocephala]